MKKIAIFGGSFNPPGLHHRRLVKELAGRHQFDEILVIPCGGRPDKPTLDDVAPIHRAVMTDLTFGNIPSVKVLLFDLEHDTYTPAWKLQEMFGAKAEVWHVVGLDLLEGGGRGESQIQTSWQRGPEIWEKLNFAVFPREGFGLQPNDLPPHHQVFQNKQGSGSSNNIREKIFHGEPFEHIVDSRMADYIKRYGLYRGAEPRLVHPVSLREPKFLFVVDEHNPSAVAYAESLRGLENKENPNAIMVFGGDGTMLRAVRTHWRKRLPFVGVNHGHHGFLLNKVSPDFHEPLVSYHTPLLYVEALGKDGISHEGVAFNDAWVERVTLNSAWVEVRVDDQVMVEKLEGDGILVATPAGSTAYASHMGAGPLPISAQTIILVGSNVKPFGWKMSYLPTSAKVEFRALAPEYRPLEGVVDSVSLGEVISLKARVSRIAAVELLFDPNEDIQQKLLEAQFPQATGRY